MEDAYLWSTSDVLSHFKVTEEDGLSDQQVQVQRSKYGHNGMRQHHLYAHLGHVADGIIQHYRKILLRRYGNSSSNNSKISWS
jgi:hypothetical protein